jgi:metallophosphoesterase (TIGR00282 family)
MGNPGLEITTRLLKSYQNKFEIDFTIANGENASEGKSITEEIAKQLYDLDIHAITTGNHLWDKWQARQLINKDRRVLRPLNYPRENGGNGYGVFDVKGKGKIGVVNIQGRTYMNPIDCPFKAMDWVIPKIQDETKVIFVDFHAEATAEKMAMGWHLDGRVSALLGTHTHIPTSDAKIFPKGMAYQTDVGMTGPYESVIGMKKDIALKRFIHQTPYKFEMASNDVHFCGTALTIDCESGKALRIERIHYPDF